MSGIELLPPVRKGKSDWRDYRGFRLQNGVTCMAVHDKESKTTAMSCAVGVGAAADPRSLSGLAHFTEHMCFLGSEKYPGENEYKSYLASHGGRSNASTSLHLTAYKFDVLAPHAEKAVDIFTNFFVAPLFTESGTSREVNAVDSENSKNLTSDARRRLQILKAIGDPNHYYTKFTTGNNLTLPATEDGSDQTKFVREALLAFHRYHYRPEKMTVTIVGPQSLDELQAWIGPRFGAIEAKSWPSSSSYGLSDIETLVENAAKDMPPFAFSEPVPDPFPAFRPELQKNRWPVLLTLKPLRSMRKLTLNFPLPPVRHLKDRNPVHVISHLLGHEGPGSSFALLQQAGYITSLSTGSRIFGPDQCMLQVDMALTETGEAEWKQVVSAIFAHCQLLMTAAKQEQYELQRIWEEDVALSKIRFDQSSPGSAYESAPSLAQSIVSNGAEACQSAGALLDETKDTFPHSLVKEYAEKLVPTNCIIERCSGTAWEEAIKDSANANFKGCPMFGQQKEQWYGIDYHLQPVEDVVNLWNQNDSTSTIDTSQLALPRPNRFIPKTLELCDELPEEARQGPRIEKPLDPPVLLVKFGQYRLWHRLDDRYALPKSSLSIVLRNSAANHVVGENGCWQHDASTKVYSSMLVNLFTQALAQETYDAELAGLRWSVTKSAGGFRISCSGYSDRLSDLALGLLEEFLKPDFIQEHYFAATKDTFVRNLKTYFMSRRADDHATYYRDLFLSSGEEVATTLEAAEASTSRALREQHNRILQNGEMEVDCLYTGNVSSSDAETFFEKAMFIIEIAAEGVTPVPNGFIAGTTERRLNLGNEIKLHFQSENPAEENGAVLVTYQSPIPGFRGNGMSPPESLKSTASMRLICHILREPLFDTLRTKQQLGYIVSSYYDIGFSSLPDSEAYPGPTTTPVDMLVVNILSNKVPPPEVVERIDEFLIDFQNRLSNMSDSEIRDHADALHTKLLKPIHHLSTEASRNLGKIIRYAPETIRGGGGDSEIPWDSVNALAGAVSKLERKDLLETWERVVHEKTQRSRIVSCVYGTSFPLQKDKVRAVRESSRSLVVDNSLDKLMKLRETLKPYDNETRRPSRTIFQGLLSTIRPMTRSKATLVAAATVMFGAGVYGALTVTRTRKSR